MKGEGAWLGVAAALAAQFSVLAFHDRITTNVTWARDIAPIIGARCVRCHNPDGPGPMDLTIYDEARPWAKAIKEEVLTRRMPKWHAVRGYGDFANDPSLSSFEIALIASWADGGAPRGVGAEIDRSALKLRTADERSTGADAARSSSSASERTRPCRAQRLPAGRLLAVRPRLERGGSVGITLVRRDGAREILAWIREFDPDFEETYWLRTPIDLARGSTLEVNASGRCELTITLAPAARTAR